MILALVVSFVVYGCGCGSSSGLWLWLSWLVVCGDWW